ncbi:MAG: VOC family protein [Pseudomonadota bacterium]|nr:VOC family protein [Pseudomonadota bacterium]
MATDADGLRVLHLKLNTANARYLADFYEKALGFRFISREHLSGARREGISPVSGRALRITLALGAQTVELDQFVDQPGRPYPEGSLASDLIFQHFAIVVADMDDAMQRLSAVSGWTSITVDGPQHLPASSGGVVAFKFRDPDGHPLELLAFPPHDTPRQWRSSGAAGPFLGIDHTAISVTDSARSIAFYEALGLAVSNRSLNDDVTQARLDHGEHPVVEVTAMAPDVATPHLELLCYRGERDEAPLDLRANDVAATCVVFGPVGERAPPIDGDAAPMCHLQDPDGHYLSIESP